LRACDRGWLDPYTNASGFDRPPLVTRVTGTGLAAPDGGGTVTRHVVWVGQPTEATTPPNDTVIIPLALTRLMPWIAMLCPAAPWVGDSPVSLGAPAGVGAAATVGVVVGGTVDDLVVGAAVDAGAAVTGAVDAGAVAADPRALAG
jgi:hypothetical protein